MTLPSPELAALRHPSESSRFRLTLLVLAPLAVVLAAFVIFTAGIALITVALVLFFVWFAVRLASASYLGNLVKASDTSFPEVVSAVAEAKARLGYAGHVDAFVYEEGSYNALLVPLLRRKVLLINSELLKPCNPTTELRFMVGRFVGSLASKHYRFSWLQAFLGGVEKLVVFNMLLYPYERAVVYSGDQMGLVFIDGDIAAGTSALMKTVVGSDIAERADVASFVGQGVASRGSFFSWLARAYSSFPHATHRVENLLRFARERFPENARRFLDSAAEPPRAVAVAAE
jgi:hypothetical protein